MVGLIGKTAIYKQENENFLVDEYLNSNHDMGYILQKHGRSIIAQHPKHQEIYNFNLKTSTIPNQNTMSPE